jgi:DNA-binding NarL/FixJ family response regulator
MNKIINILIADDHQMFIDGLVAMFKEHNFIQVKATANNGKEAIQKLKENDFDVVLLDINMPELNGIEAARIITIKYPQTKIIILTSYIEKELVAQLLKIGINGYVLKNTDRNELEMAIEGVCKGQKYFSGDVALNLIDATTRETYSDTFLKSDQALTNRETEILKLITKELTTKEIANKLSITEFTVKTHRKHLISKLQVKNLAGLVKYAVLNGLAD